MAGERNAVLWKIPINMYGIWQRIMKDGINDRFILFLLEPPGTWFSSGVSLWFLVTESGKRMRCGRIFEF